MKIIIGGALGHMGREVAAQAKSQGHDILFGIDAAQGQADFPVYPSFQEAPQVKDAVIVDFSRPELLDGLLRYALANGAPAVLATTGYSEEELKRIDAAAEQIPVFRSYNMSLGVAVLCALCRKAAAILGDGYDVEIVEAHHRRKVDAPSGTAVMLYNAVKDAYDEPRTAQYGRSGKSCKRTDTEIGMHSLRGGTVIGEHQVSFLGTYERVQLSHSAESRALFASGALRAADFLKDQKPGLYNMDALVGDI